MSSGERPPLIVFRTTAGEQIGLGHFRRCLTLAKELEAQGAALHFLLAGDDAGAAVAQRAGVPFERVATEAGATLECLATLTPVGLVIDDYAFGSAEFSSCRGRAWVLALDDLADRALDVDAVLNASARAERLPYRLPPGCVTLFGPSYALLRSSFRDQPRRRASLEPRRLLLTLGGADPHDQTGRLARAVSAGFPGWSIDVVLGPLSGGSEELARAADRGDIVLHRAPEELAPLMAAADLAISGGGQTTYELAAMGLPTVGLLLAENQRENLEAMSEAGTLVAVEAESEILPALEYLAGDVLRRQHMTEAGQRFVDGRGAQRVAAFVLGAVDTRRAGELHA